jgi:hypothetical protein
MGVLMVSPDKRVHRLVMSCLEDATELDPAAQRRVEEVTATLSPPRTDTQ